MDLSEPVKGKPPSAHRDLAAAKKVNEERDIDISSPAAQRLDHRPRHLPAVEE